MINQNWEGWGRGKFKFWHYAAIVVVLALAGFIISSTFKVRKNNDLKGIYGWLLFFVIKLSLIVIVAPAGVYSEYYKAFDDNPELKNLVEFQNLYKISQIIAWLQPLISLYMIYILKTKKSLGLSGQL